MNPKLFSKDFTLVVIGQIISLLGNAAIRFALPLYLLNQTGSSALYGTVTACAFIPAILLSPIGGIAADRVNKRNIMVALDFSTAGMVLAVSLLMGKVNLVVLLAAALMLLYGIAGAYQPSVQASVPALVPQSHVMAANSVINMVNSLASLLGPVLGGILYSAYGLRPVLKGCMACFLVSAVMEIFIHIPFQKQTANGNIWMTVKGDFGESIHFIRKEKPFIGKGLLVICGINLFLSAMIIVGLPYMITEVMDFGEAQANILYGFSQGAMAAGGLTGGICGGIFAEKFSIHKVGNLLILCAACAFPMGLVFVFVSSEIFCYLIMTVSCFMMMIFSTVFGIMMLSFVQTETPGHLVGKVISVTLTVSMCAQPLGNALYGVLFEVCRGFEYGVILFSGMASLWIALKAGNIFGKLSLSHD